MGPVAGNSVSARGVPRNQPGGAPVSLLPKANTVVQTRNPNSVIAGGSGRENFPVALSTGVFLPDKRNDEVLGEAGEPGRSPPRPTREARGPGPPSTPRPDWRAPRGGGPSWVGPGPCLTWNPRPAPTGGLGVPRRPQPAPLTPPPAHGLLGGGLLPAHLRRGEQGGGAAAIYIKGQPARPAEAGAPGPSGPAPPRPRPRQPRAERAGRSEGALGGRAPRSDQSAARGGAGAGTRPARKCTRRCRPAPGLTCAHLVAERYAAPCVPPPPGGRNSSRNARRLWATSQARQHRRFVLPTNPAWSC